MSIIPLGHRLLVKPEDLKEVDPLLAKAKELGIHIESDELKRDQAAVDKGTVVAIGDTAFKDFGETPWCSVGDLVAFTRYGGKTLKDPEDNVEYIILNDEDVIAKYSKKE